MPSILGFPKKLIVATGTSVLANPNLEGLETVETTRPRKQSGHLPSPLLLARSLLALAIKKGSHLPLSSPRCLHGKVGEICNYSHG